MSSRPGTSSPGPSDQLTQAVGRGVRVLEGARAIETTGLNGILDDWGTAVNVQQMVFGNRGERSGSGAAVSRDEISRGPRPSGDFLLDAPGRGGGLGHARRAPEIRRP